VRSFAVQTLRTHNLEEPHALLPRGPIKVSSWPPHV
jgi:hypothetical protein